MFYSDFGSTFGRGVLYFLPSLLEGYAAPRIHLGKILAQQNHRSFVFNNKEKLSKIDQEITRYWCHIAENIPKEIQKCRWIQCVGASVSTIPLLEITIASSFVLGFYGLGVATIVVLTPLIAKLLSAIFEPTDCENVKSCLDAVNQKLAKARVAGVMAILSYSSFQNGGLYGGLFFIGKLAAFGYVFETYFPVAMKMYFKFLLNYIEKENITKKEADQLRHLVLKSQSLQCSRIDDEQWVLESMQDIFSKKSHGIDPESDQQRDARLKELIAEYKKILVEVDAHLSPLRADKIKNYCQRKIKKAEEKLKNENPSHLPKVTTLEGISADQSLDDLD